MSDAPSSEPVAGEPRWPESTYRLQFHAGFTFEQAAAITPYLSLLGITHVYASPYFKACAGSRHGYDVIDHNQLSPEIGSPGTFDAWVESLRRAGMSHILDIVPNHVGVATNENAWWNSVLENGPSSPYGRFFDIDWEDVLHPQVAGRLVLPVLGDTYGAVVEKGELRLSFDPREARVFVNYYDRRFPIEPASSARVLGHRLGSLCQVPEADHEEYERLVRALAGLPGFTDTDPQQIDRRHEEVAGLRRRLAALLQRNPALLVFVQENIRQFGGRAGDAESFNRLDDLLTAQPYRLSWWRNAAHEINYRRFFDISDLAALAMEREEVFAHAHQLIFRLLAAGKLAGLRIDHPDGLYDPAAYLRRLQERYRNEVAGARAVNGSPLYVVVEKILTLDEELAPWPVAGTSGYDFLNQVNLLFVDAAAEEAFTQLYAQYTGDARSFGQVVYEKKLLMLDAAFAGDLARLALRLLRLAQGDRWGKDFSLRSLQEALRQVIACFGVYRTYITGAEVTPADRTQIEAAIEQARGRSGAALAPVYHYLREVLLQRYPATLPPPQREAWLRFAGRFQQFTAPVAAKGVEDTAFYNYHRLLSLNEVGGDPGRFGQSPASLHAWFARRQAKWPCSLSPLSTHDTKRSEDVRARLNVLSELPSEWRQHVLYWREVNAPLRQRGGAQAPSPGEEYLIYQTLLGAWPMEPLPVGDAEFLRRMQAYLQKATREAREHTSWTDPDAAHEGAVSQFLAAILDPRPREGEAFLADFLPFQTRISEYGMANSLAQTALRLTAPGVPDTYQGTELWDLSLVDPDNRRAVDYDVRHRLLQQMVSAAETDLPQLLRELVQHRRDGRIKLYLLWRLLSARRQRPGLFTRGHYFPCQTSGERHKSVFAFVRELEGQAALVAVPRLLSHFSPAPFAISPGEWRDTQIHRPPSVNSRPHRNILTGESLEVAGSITAASLFTQYPVAVLLHE